VVALQNVPRRLVKVYSVSGNRRFFYPDPENLNGQSEDGNLSVVVQEDRLFNFDMVSPLRLMEVLNENVIGQDHAKKTLSVAVYTHHKRLLCNGIFTQDNVPDKEVIAEDLKDVKIEKSNIC
jgi:ATP-dependent protease Clp ATPase subunit